MEVKNFGTLYIRRKAASVGRNYALYKNRPELSIGDTVAGKEIPWVEANGLLVADKILVYGISWYDLNVLGLITGKRVSIDGKPYNLRLSGQTPDGRDEWDAILDSLYEQYDRSVFWDPKGTYSWTQIAWKNDGTHKILRGGVETRGLISYSIYTALKTTGWRPILEPIQLPLCDMQKKRVKVDGKFGDVQGILVSYTDYDIVLAIPGELPETAVCGRFCAKLKPGLYALDRCMVKSVEVEEST